MTLLRLTYDPDSPRDIADFLKTITQLWVSKNNGISRAKRHLRLMLEQGSIDNARRFMQQAYYSLHRQLPLTTDRGQYLLKEEISELLATMSRGGT